MKNLLLLLWVVVCTYSCSQKDKEKSSAQTKKEAPKPEYLLSKDGIGELKIGMTQAELEKLLGRQLVMKHAADTGEIWADTAVAKYRDMEVSMYFERQYNQDNSIKIMELAALGTSSPLCKTANGLGVGDERSAIIAAYEDNPINMGPESIMVNDSTWALSKTAYYINISDDKWDRQIVFRLVNKKVASLEAALLVGD
jgi:hypothetical protein